MKKGEFIQVSKMMVKESFNRHICDTSKTEKISANDVEVIGFHEDPNGYKILLQTPISDGLYYGVSYDINTDNLNSYTYKKVGKRVNGRKNKFYRSDRSFR